MRRSWLVGAVFLVSVTAVFHAQSSEGIRGVVVDPDHAAIPEATLRLLAPDGSELARTLTDQQGRFSFRQNCSDCSLEVQLIGFQIRHLPASSEARVIQLEVAPIEENVVVTANRTGTPSVFVGSTTTVITTDEIAARQAPVVGDLLQSVPGVTTNRSGGYGAVTSMFTRGAIAITPRSCWMGFRLISLAAFSISALWRPRTSTTSKSCADRSRRCLDPTQ